MTFLPAPLPTTVDTVADLATRDAKTGDGKVVTTIGHVTVGDNGAAMYVYHATGRSGVTVNKRNIAGPGVDDYFSLLVVDEIKTKQVGTVGDGVVNDRAALAEADTIATAAGGVQITITPGVYLISTSLTIVNKVVFHPGARIKIASGATLTLSGGFVAEDDQYIFEVVSGGAVVTAKVSAVTPNHFGATTATANIKPYFDVALATAVASGIIMKLPAGSYTSTGTITLETLSNVNITGVGIGKSELHFSAGYLDCIEITGLRISNLTISGENQEANGIYVRVGSSSVTISNCHIKDFTDPSDPSTIKGLVNMLDVTGGATVTDCIFTGTGAHTCADITMNNCEEIIITDNQCLSVNGDGPSVAAISSNLQLRGVISNNVIKTKRRHGILLAYGAQKSDFTVNGNVIHDCWNNGVYYNPGNEPATFYSGRLTLTGNTITNCGGQSVGDGAGNSGIHIGGHLGGTCTGNTIVDSGYYPDVDFATTSGNNLTSTAHGLSVGAKIRLSGSSLPTPLTERSYYVATVVDANNFTVAATAITTPITLTGTGSGTYAAVRGTGRGRGILIAGASNWTITGNTIKGSAAAAMETNAAFLANNLVIHSNLLLDNGLELYQANIVISNANQTEDMHLSICDNIIASEKVDCDGILLFSGSSASTATGIEMRVVGNEFRGMKAGTDKAAIRWNEERYAPSEIYDNYFRNYDSAFWSQNNLYSDDEDWAFGFMVRMDRNTFHNVTLPFDFKEINYSAVGKNNVFIDCTPNFGQTIIPATATNDILDGYYVELLPDRKCRTGDRFLPLYPGGAAEAQWLNTTPAATPVAFVNSSGNNLTATGHGLTLYNRVRLAGGSLPSPLTPGDYWVSAVVDANNFTVHRNLIPLAIPLTGTGSGTFQVLDQDPTWLSDNWNPLNLKPNLVSKWNGANQSALDQQARQNLTWTGTPAYAAAPADKGPGYAFDFDGSTNGLQATIPTYADTDQLTICAFIRPGDVSGFTKILWENFATSNGWQFAISGDATYFFDGNSNINVVSVGLELDEWIHIALVFDGANSGVFANGVRMSTFTMNWIGTPPDILSIGRQRHNNQFHFSGEMFDVRLYQVALTTGQLASLVGGPTAGYTESVVYGVDADGNLLRPVAATRKNLANALKIGVNNVFDYSDATISDGTTDARAAILAADSDGPIYLPPGVYAIATDMTVTNRVVFDPGASLKPASGVTVTLSGGYTAQPQQSVFDASASGLFVATNTANELADATVTAAAASAAITATTYLNLLANATIANAGLTTSGFTVDNTNKRVTYVGLATTTFRVSICASLISSKSTEVARFRLAKNGTTDGDTEVARKLGTGADVVDVHIQGTFSLTRNDYIELFGTLDASTSDTITIQKCNISIVKV